MKKVKLYVISICALLSLSSYAGIYAEPALACGFNGSSGSGLGYEAKLGYKKMGIWAGVEYYDRTIDDANMGYHNNLVALTIGYEFPQYYRIWAGPIISGDDDGLFGIAAGIGYKLLSVVPGLAGLYMNLEYRTISSDNLKNRHYATVTISIPFDL